MRNKSRILFRYRKQAYGQLTSYEDEPLAAGEITVGTGENMKKLTSNRKSLFLENITFWAGSYPIFPQHLAFTGAERLPWQHICKTAIFREILQTYKNVNIINCMPAISVDFTSTKS